MVPQPATIAELRATGYPDRTVKEELRANLLERLGSGVPLFPQVVGFEDSVLPVLERGLLAGTQQTWPVYLFAQLRVPSLLPQLIAVSSVVFVASMLLVLSAEIGRRLAERRFGRQYTARGLV